MATIPEGSCTAQTLGGVGNSVTTPQTLNRWYIRDNLGGAILADGIFPGSSGSNANGWAVSGTVPSPLICPPLGAKRVTQYYIFLDMSAGLPVGATSNNYQGLFNVGSAVVPCARPAPPVFTASTNASLINLTGTK